ncbi:MAG: ferrous iron transport protein B [Candidatus Bathyarchaeota archaeon]|nr:ferrous iron transport protein B [Candidatus Bathyarchaeum tardum]WGM88619.1 MAG: ferrous iron transport protein B [Candidatus Bathyarchaeum tardum]WNZ29125.1 MAG: ferrous iron transport protein B [Candidatus Bathyarchaeota archaeon]
MKEKNFTIALAGNANVGKSVIFNQLTGLHQHIGNWPGKTVEKAEGTLNYKGYTIDFVDLPGIYSLSTYSIEELVSREYIATEKPDLVINVVDASLLERNLFFTLQLLELEAPLLIALNQIDLAKKKGILIDTNKAEKVLGVPVVPTVAVTGKGISDMLDIAIAVIEKNCKTHPLKPKYGKEIEEKINQLVELLKSTDLKYPPRWIAIKLLDEDKEIEKLVHEQNSQITKIAEKLRGDLEKCHGHSCPTVITSERYQVASIIANEIQQITEPVKTPLREKLHTATTHRVFGYPIMLGTILAVFVAIFSFGDFTSALVGDFLMGLQPTVESVLGTGIVTELLWGGIMEGIIGGITVALPYILPFYFILYLFEDSGYLSRIAFLMDRLMHRMGLHGKAFIPVMLSFGCNVPGCLGCRIMETSRERLLTAFVVTLIPCAATSVIILGLVGAHVGIEWALALYIINLILVFVLGRIAFKALPGEPTELIMEMSDYRIPHMKTVTKQTWFRLREFIVMAFPLIIAGSFVIKLAEVANLLEPIANIASPITVAWLGLPAVTGIALIFGVLRKELTLIMLATLLGTTNFATVMTPTQMIVFTLVVMLYIPCVATIGALVKEFGWKKATTITVIEIALALVLGGIAFRLLTII